MNIQINDEVVLEDGRIFTFITDNHPLSILSPAFGFNYQGRYYLSASQAIIYHYYKLTNNRHLITPDLLDNINFKPRSDLIASISTQGALSQLEHLIYEVLKARAYQVKELKNLYLTKVGQSFLSIESISSDLTFYPGHMLKLEPSFGDYKSALLRALIMKINEVLIYLEGYIQLYLV